jgi:hypothetical protein
MYHIVGILLHQLWMGNGPCVADIILLMIVACRRRRHGVCVVLGLVTCANPSPLFESLSSSIVA